MKKYLVVLLCCVGALVFWSRCSSDPVTLVWQEEDGYRRADLAVPQRGSPGFEEVPSSKTGVSFVNTLSEEELLSNRHTMNGSGVALGDVDGDGWTDIYFAHLSGDNVLYRNLGGWRFEDITQQAGVAAPHRFSTGAVFADIDGDEDLDLFVTAMGGPNVAFLNDGTGHFTEVTRERGLSSSMGSTSMAFSDVDGDGDLDLYVGTYKTISINDLLPPQERAFERTLQKDGDEFSVIPEFEEHYKVMVREGKLIRLEYGEPDQFYLNDGNGYFAPVDLAGGLFLDERGNPTDLTQDNWALTVRFQDINEDGFPDLYVCNDFESPDHIWLGDGTGRFHAAPALSLRKTSLSTMSVDFSDVDRDGHLDFFLTDMLSQEHGRRLTQVGLTLPMPTGVGEIDDRPQAVQNTLFWNRGDQTYAEIAHVAGVEASEWSWANIFHDVDLDGYEDLLITTGHVYDVQSADGQEHELMRLNAARDFRRLLLDFPRLPLRNVAFRNKGDRTFEMVPDGWGLGQGEDISHGLALADLDHDGDLDAVTNRLNQEAGLFRNEATAPRIAVRLQGQAPNTQGIGAKIKVTQGSSEQVKEVISGGQYLSGSDPIYSFAATDIDDSSSPSITIEVTWRNGKRSVIEDARVNRVYEIYESNAGDHPSSETPLSPSHAFTNETERLAHTHHETLFDDFSIQPLLPRKLSQQGPGLAFVDFDRDGDEDLLIGNGRGGKLSVHRNDGQGAFTALSASVPEAKGDQTGIVTMYRAEGGALVFVGVTGYELGPRDSSYVNVYALSRTGDLRQVQRLNFGLSSIGPLALADVDGDADLDLFAGGRFLPGRYPEPASSRIYLNQGGRFTFDSDRSEPFEALGLVSGAAFGDADQDGDADLFLATEGDPIRYFVNPGDGHFREETAAYGLSSYSGLWNGVALGDFDNDGRLDLVGSNWGWNARHGRVHNQQHPLRIYYSDFDVDGTVDIVESHYDATLGDYVPDRGLTMLSNAMPYVRSRMPTHQQYATSTLRDIIGPKLDRSGYLEMHSLAAMVFLNRGDHFEGHALPLDAQLAPSMGIAIGDVDADGNEDIFLSQNFFAVPVDVPRLDAGRGLWLRGKGTGEFEAWDGTFSGIKVYGEQRGAALADINQDGRIDVAVTQNGTSTHLYQNTSQQQGIRVPLPIEATSRVGTVVRLKYEDGSLGPARLIHAGSGYWSQSSQIQVLGQKTDKVATSVVVFSPGGAETEIPLK